MEIKNKMTELVIPLKLDSEKKFWSLIRNNSRVSFSELRDKIGKNPFYRIFQTIEKLEQTKNIKIIKRKIGLCESRPVYFYEKTAQIELEETPQETIVSICL